MSGDVTLSAPAAHGVVPLDHGNESDNPADNDHPEQDSPKKKLEDQALREFDNISLREILDQDSRPTFVLDLDSDYLDYSSSTSGCTLQPLFCNAALREYENLLDAVTIGHASASHAQSPDIGTQDVPPAATTFHNFTAWAKGVTHHDDSRDIFPLTILYHNLLWTGSTIRHRWRVISGNQCYVADQLPKRNLAADALGGSKLPELAPVTTLPERDLRPPKLILQPATTTVLDTASTVPSSTFESAKRPRADKLESTLQSSTGTSDETANSSASVTIASPNTGMADWTAKDPGDALTEHMKFARGVDWAATPLGSMESWSVEFREITNLVMRNPHPAAIFFGPTLSMLYNEAYKIEVAGNKHPALIGSDFSGPFKEIWEGLAPIFRECARTGKAVRKENDRLLIHRYGYQEETFFSWSWVPIYGGTNRILGFYNAPFETTYQTISSRRLHTLRLLGEKVAGARSVKHFWQCVMEGLEDNHFDVPFALLYSISESDSDDNDTASHSSDSTISLKSCLLEGSIGIPAGHAASPPKLDLRRSKEGFVPAFREAMRTREPTTLHTRNGSLPESLIEGIEWRGHGVPCSEAIIIPIRPTNGENIFAFLLVGINPRRAYDADYKAFVAMLNRQLASSLASFILFEEEVRRNRSAAEAAVLQREQLTQQLELQANRMRRMTELSPLGMYLFSPDGALLEANDRYYEMTGHPREDDTMFLFLDYIAEDSRATAREMWDVMIETNTPQSRELQIVNPKVIPRDLTGEPIEFWVMASSSPELGDDGKLISIMGSITNVSHMKWAQGLQARRLHEAEERKRQQINFMDITSHEMRNPLSAVLICADDIRESLSQCQFSGNEAKVVQECIEAANNIALCVQHQKSIVDDVLTVSKLDSNLLLVTPVSVQPVAVIQRAMGMFRPEMQAKEIDFTFHQGQSVQDLELDWVNIDPSRLLQIIVNLITNAIKFTQGLPTRQISVHLNVSTEQPNLMDNGFEYVPMRTSIVNVTEGEEWGQGQLLYLRIHVTDTGCGLTTEEKRVLFERFSQASPRTHAQYGGSGLGLFICRQLAELHGGQIGVSSEANRGSSFGFFIRSRRAAPSAQPTIWHAPSTAVAAAAAAKSEEAIPLKEPSIPKPTPSSELHVLVVEDNIVNQRVLCKQLRKAGCTVATADNGLEALSYLATTFFQDPGGTPLSVILMDLNMPLCSGVECVRRIRELQAQGVVMRHVPTIAVTANVRPEQKKEALEAGMDDVVSKPFRIPDLFAKITVVLDRLGRVEDG